MRICFSGPLLGLLLSAAHPAFAAEPLSDLPRALSTGRPHLDARLRYEQVGSDAAATPDDAQALSLRARLSYTTQRWNALDAQLEYESVSVDDQNSYNSGINGVTQRPVIADPAGEELNQAWLRYTGVPATSIKLGRQRYLLDNQRFVGNVGWRQNEQTFDGISVQSQPLAALQLSYAYFHNVNTVQFKNLPMRGVHLLNGAYRLGEGLQLSAYGYWLDFDAASMAANRQDSRTLGVRGIGAQALPQEWQLAYALEFAQQRPYADAADSVEARYVLTELKLSRSDIGASLGYEQLGSPHGSYGFQTPLATLHVFNGWADQFLLTPAKGLQDRYLGLEAQRWQTRFNLVYHRFNADHGPGDYGREWDASVARPLSAQLAVLAKYARYEAQDFSVDTRKLWVQLEFKF